MDKQTIIIAAVIGLLAVSAVLWFVWKVYFRLFKHFLIALLIGLAGAAIYYYRSLPPPPDPSLGKHAYLSASGKYLGVVEGQGEDNRRGPVWIIRPPGGYQVIYAKSRVVLKDKREPELRDESAPAPSPASANRNPRKKK
jgi:hypothetical protein